jgi:hypothetical protein
MKVSVWRRFGAVLAMVVAGALTSTGANAAVGSASPVTNPAEIKALATDAYVWGLPGEFIYRFENYNNLVTAPRNTFGGGAVPAAWNNNATNAGDASVLYLNAMIDLSGQKSRGGTQELVLTVPPSNTGYYVVSLLDDFINTVGSIGTRTMPSASPQTYPAPGSDTQASILPPPNGSLDATYVFPAL